MRRFLFILSIGFALLTSSCAKEPGEGGRASISGKVYVEDYNGNCSELRDEYYGIDEDVYIIAGDDPSYFDKVKTGPDGTFWFPYLRQGDYRVYALSEDCDAPGDLKSVTKNITIDGRKQEITTEDIVVIR